MVRDYGLFPGKGTVCVQQDLGDIKPQYKLRQQSVGELVRGCLLYTSIGAVIAVVILIALIIALIVTNIRIVPQANAYVLERLGAYYGTWQVGLHFKIPLIDKVARKVSLKEHVIRCV